MNDRKNTDRNYFVLVKRGKKIGLAEISMSKVPVPGTCFERVATFKSGSRTRIWTVIKLFSETEAKFLHGLKSIGLFDKVKELIEIK